MDTLLSSLWARRLSLQYANTPKLNCFCLTVQEAEFGMIELADGIIYLADLVMGADGIRVSLPTAAEFRIDMHIVQDSRSRGS
jgi:hypothetical protein